MKTLFLMLLLYYSSLNYYSLEKQAIPHPLDSLVTGKWTNKRTQIQYIVDSHLVHEEEVTEEKGKVYTFNGKTVRVEYPNGATEQGTYTVMREEDQKKIEISLPSATTTYNLIAVTPTGMVWQKDLEDTYYHAGPIRKSAERAIYTEEFLK